VNFENRAEYLPFGGDTLPLTCADGNHGNIFDIGYDFHLSNGNNGNVLALTNFKDATRNQSFVYDSVNRLTSAQNAGTDCNVLILQNKTKFWGNTYSYDDWGNLYSKTITKCGAESLSVTPLANNQLSGYGYDAAGNMTNDPTDHVTPTYDQENRLTGAAGYTYTYDADGNRVRKSNGSTGTLYWAMMPGVVAETDLAGTTKSEYIFFDGGRVARRDGPTGADGVFYYFSDHLKTASVITDATGTIKAESDYYPWGGELQFVANDSNHYKFTGKERDGESGLDNMGARYYSSGLGRFVTPDWAAKPAAVPYAVLGDPQSLNLYTYVRNIPTTTFDPDGHLADYYDDKGKRIGTDGNNDGKNYVVFNKNDVKSVESGNVAQPPASAVLQPSADVKTAINDAVKASNAPSGDDKKGGFHEEGGVFGTTTGGQQIAIPAKPGAYSPPGADKATIDPGNAKDPSKTQNLTSVDGAYHVHPSGSADGRSFVQPPSAADRAAALPNGTSIVVGAGDQKVYFYNGNGTVGTMSLKNFNKVP
jgi:RHS repeat-associated protein